MGYGRNGSSTWRSANVSTTLQRFSVVNSIGSISQTSKASTTPLLSRPAIAQLFDLVLGTPYLLPWTLRSNDRAAGPRFPNGPERSRTGLFLSGTTFPNLRRWLVGLLSRLSPFSIRNFSHSLAVSRFKNLQSRRLLADGVGYSIPVDLSLSSRRFFKRTLPVCSRN